MFVDKLTIILTIINQFLCRTFLIIHKLKFLYGAMLLRKENIITVDNLHVVLPPLMVSNVQQCATYLTKAKVYTGYILQKITTVMGHWKEYIQIMHQHC